VSGLVGACFGDPHDPSTLSGVAKHLFDALERRFGLAARIDYRLRPWQRILVAGRSVRLSRSDWQERYHLNSLSFGFRSGNLRRAVSRVAGPGDTVVQIFGVVQPGGTPYVVYADQTWLMAAEHWQRWLPSQVGEREEWIERERRMYQGARHVFTMAGPAAESLQLSYGVPSERVTVVGGGVNFDPLPVLSGPDRREPVILFVGRDPLRKGCDTLVSALRLVRARIPDARLQVIGTSDVPEEPGVEVLGRVSGRGPIEEAYRRAAVFCLPSRYEPYGLALVEAMAYGLPCVGTRVGGIPEIVVDGETGRLVGPDDARGLASALVSILDDPGRARSFGSAGRARVERELTWDAVAGRMAPALGR
jgi:glycosyltransferase involved in cell wall biosynthesis